ncbi:uncharacterized protein zgc:109986 isoform X2 [Cyclopterus lumpus]|uniref:uncharacterized protein zgc:109986 isoform X2 n=1 Tax=Cyclopterus lumpus TaxID=8103 RepID=UPI0014867CE9|nr:uncharacterized protein zgc:109986 isoform X2 [Cyclopterus lumpus]
MNYSEAKYELKKLLNKVKPGDVSRLVTWLRSSDELDEFLSNNQTTILQNIAEDLRGSLPPDAMLSSENTAHNKIQQCSRPTVHVDGFLYDEDQVDALCDEGTMSRSYCLTCGSHRTAPLDFISHSFSISELQFLFENVLPDLSGRLLVDVGSRLGAVLYAGHVFSSASRLVGLEISEEFVKLQKNILQKYNFMDRIQVLHTDVLLQNVLLQNADVLIMNNVFEFFMEPSEQSVEVHHGELQEERVSADLRPRSAGESEQSAGTSAARLGGGTSCGLRRVPGQGHGPGRSETDPPVQGHLIRTRCLNLLVYSALIGCCSSLSKLMLILEDLVL